MAFGTGFKRQSQANSSLFMDHFWSREIAYILRSMKLWGKTSFTAACREAGYPCLRSEFETSGPSVPKLQETWLVVRHFSGFQQEKVLIVPLCLSLSKFLYGFEVGVQLSVPKMVLSHLL